MPHASLWNDDGYTTQLASLVWTASPVVRLYLHRLATGDPGTDWVTGVRNRYLPAIVDRALVLGCGSGWLERALAEKGGFRKIVACDFAADTVDRARERASAAGHTAIEYRVVDLERDALPEGPFDAIVANDVLHHITDLERLYGLIHDALAPRGRFAFNEYVGPNRFQYGDERMELINRYFRLFPDRLRWDPVVNGPIWKRSRVDPVKLAAEDPTEAVRSEDVLPLARARFTRVAEIPYGGGLLNPLLFGVILGFQPGRDDRLMEVLCDAEDRLTREGAIDPDFHIFVGARRHGADAIARQDQAAVLPGD